MAKYAKTIRGNFIKARNVKSGTRFVFLDEVKPIAGKYRDEVGQLKSQNIATIRLEDGTEGLFRVNLQSIEGLLDAYGDDSLEWVGKSLTLHVEKAMIGNKRFSVGYVIPEGYQLGFESGPDGEEYARVEKI